MTEVLHAPSSFPSSTSSSSSLSCAPPISCVADDGCSTATNCDSEELKDRDKQSTENLSLLAVLVTLFRKSLLACKSDRRGFCKMEIGWPTNVRHIAHVTFDRFNGFLGLPVELEPDVLRRPPSASATVFGVSTESMQLSYDSRGNSVPTILLLMQSRLYAQGGLQAEGIFRVNAENSQEEHVRDQLNRGLVPEGIDVHCLAGLVKAWFRELPTGVLDSLSPDRVMQCQTEDDCAELARYLPPTEASLLDWAINLMADVVQQEHLNKMNAHNIAVVFAPNMTQMADPLTALMYAVQVMNFLKTLVLRTLRERKDSVIESSPGSYFGPSDENGHGGPLQFCQEDTAQENEDAHKTLVSEKIPLESSPDSLQNNNLTGEESGSLITPSENPVYNGDLYCEFPPRGKVDKNGTDQSSNFNIGKGPIKTGVQQAMILGTMPV